MNSLPPDGLLARANEDFVFLENFCRDEQAELITKSRKEQGVKRVSRSNSPLGNLLSNNDNPQDGIAFDD